MIYWNIDPVLRIRYVYLGSKCFPTRIRIKEFKYLNFKYTKKLFLSRVADPDPYWIRIGIQHKMLDPDPDEMNSDPQPCF
jgi:hypothetical protein